MSKPVITRFAPSPTGFLHIGGARTALFNWAYARHNEGKFLLRIEDTDRARSTQAAIDAILDGLSWLGLYWDAEPVFQHQNLARHAQVAEQLLSDGKAYKCYCTPEELEEMRDAARAAGKPPRYDGRWRDRTDLPDANGADIIKPVIRFKVPNTGSTIIEDGVQGAVKIDNDQLDDLILLRSDGTPTYMLSVVVDDHDMGVTHVIRGDDHLTNAARQIQIYQALGWDLPEFSHIPLIHGEDGAKLSKRHGALGTDAYRDMGILPRAMRNYLARLGWSHGDDELFSTQQLIEWFDLPAIGKSPARFDLEKLFFVNAHHMREASDDDLFQAILERNALAANQEARIRAALPALKDRSKSLDELAKEANFLFADRPISLNEKAKSQLTPERLELMTKLLSNMENWSDWTRDGCETSLKQFMEVNGLKLGQIGPGIRAALTGVTDAPGIYDILAFLGASEVQARIRDQIG
jgi:glutamyl-tRNA synthetase